MTHKIKILEPYADAIVEGRKNFEVRFNDRGYNAGDFPIDAEPFDMAIEALEHKHGEWQVYYDGDFYCKDGERKILPKD